MTNKQWNEIEFFKPYEFDSPDLPGSGIGMKYEFMKKLDLARKIAEEKGKLYGIKIYFIINSGIRTKQHNKKVGGVKNSSHLDGWAADIKVKNSFERMIILNSLVEAGLGTRIGIADSFIHVDSDPYKSDYCWLYNTSLIKRFFNKEDV